MKKRTKLITAGVTVLAVAAGGTGLAVAGSGDDDTGDSDAAITGSALDQAEAAALDHTGEGSVTETEVGDEESYYEVEVTLDDGSARPTSARPRLQRRRRRERCRRV